MRLFRVQWLDDLITTTVAFVCGFALVLFIGGATVLILGIAFGYWWRVFLIGLGLLG